MPNLRLGACDTVNRAITLVGLGLFAYALYNYAFYAFGAAFNALYLVYVGILTGATLGLIVGLTSAPVVAIASRVRAPSGHRGIGLLIASIAGVLGTFWIAQAMRVVSLVPMLWAVVGSSAAVALGIRADLALVIAAALLMLDVLAPSALGDRAARSR